MENLENVPVGAIIHYVAKRFKARIRTLCAEKGINSTFSLIIMALAKANHPLSQNDIAESAHLSAPTTSLTLKQMEAEGIIEKVQDPKDSRKSLVILSQKGLTLDSLIRECFKVAEEEMVRGLDPKTIENLKAVFYQMNSNLDVQEENK